MTRRIQSAGSWSVYWHNWLIYSSEISRGLDIDELLPTPHLSQNEIDAAKTVTFAEANAQVESFPVARSKVFRCGDRRARPLVGQRRL